MGLQTEYAQFIKDLPRADTPMPDISAYLLAGEKAQAVFFELPAGSSVPPHSHGAQWGIIVDGSIELTIGGVTRVYKKGDSYYIGDQVEHSATVTEPCLAIDFFADPDRYQPKPGE